MNQPTGAIPVPATGTPLSRVLALPPQIPDHEVLRLIGRGSYGEVWLAKSVLGSYRAVKFVQRSAFTEARPFEREFSGIKRFEPISRTHPHLISILHVGRNEAGGYFYCIMEVADDVASGQAINPAAYQPRTLASDLAARNCLPLGECLQIGLSLASALKHLHHHGLVHRDVKPANVVFVNGAPKLADIGLVTALAEATTALGTRGYSPPEDPGTTSADLYSLGKLLYEISTGKAPSQFPDLPTELDAKGAGEQFMRFNEILLRACDSNPQNRFHSAEAMRAALSRCVERTHGENLAESRDLALARTARQSEPGERRVLTVLAVNIGRTTQADPEVAEAFMRSVLEIIRTAVQHYDGALVQTLGDGAIAAFGGVLAVEDHARRAAHAALAIRDTLESRRPQLIATFEFGFELRTSLNTGLAIATRDNPAHPPAGDAVNQATRILSLAGPGQLLLTEETWKTVKDYFVTRPLAQRLPEGQAAAASLHELLGARELRTRIEVQAERGLTPFVGRRKELALLAERLAETGAGRGQIVLLAGEPGVGKSRLLLEFRRSLEGRDIAWLAGRSISFGGQMAYLPIIDLLKQLFQLEAVSEQSSLARRLETEAQAIGPEITAALPLIKHLLSLPPDDESVAAMDAQQRRVRTFEAIRNLLVKKARQRPVVLAVEDLHWVDRTSEDFLVSFADSLAMVRVLMLLTYRPGYRNPFPERSFITRLMLQPLSDDESLALAGQVHTVAALPPALRQRVITKADGNPFFVEEMIKSLVENSAFPGPSEESDPAATAHIQIPDTIQEVILGRIDRLEESPRRTLQLASVIGREFSVNLLETIADLSEPLADSLQTLKKLELIYERSLFLEYVCFFKHALTQEVVYNSLLLQRRKELHCLVAASLEELHAQRLGEFYELLAYHYERGEEWERALDYLRRAAERCRGVGAYREEAIHLSHALAIAQKLGQTAAVTELVGRRGIARVKCGLWTNAAPDLETALAGVPSEDLARRAELLSSLAGACFWGLNVPGMQRYAAEGQALAEKAGPLSSDLRAELLAWRGATYQVQGNLTSAQALFEQALAQGNGFSSAALANYPMTLYWQGHIAEAVQRARESVNAFRDLSDMFAATFGHAHLGLALAAAGLYAEATRVFQQATEMGLKHEVWTFHARALGMSAGFHLDVFDFAGNEALAQEARERARSAGFHPSDVSASIDLVFNFTRRGEVAQAERLARESELLAARIGGWHQWLWQLRLKQAYAELACARSEWLPAVNLARDAIAEARAHGRPKYVVAGLETRARALATLGRTTEAVADLRPAVQLARDMGDPALFLRAATGLLAVDGSDALLAEARHTARQILAELPTEDMRRHFQSAEPIQRLGPLQPGC